MVDNYSKRFASKSAVEEYAAIYLEKDSYANTIYSIEKKFLLDFVNNFKNSGI